MRSRSRAGAKKLGSLIVAVNVVGSLFYGSLLGCFVVAFAFKRVGAAPCFWACWRAKPRFSGRSCAAHFYLWYNVIGCVVVVGFRWRLPGSRPRPSPDQVARQRNDVDPEPYQSARQRHWGVPNYSIAATKASRSASGRPFWKRESCCHLEDLVLQAAPISPSVQSTSPQ